MTSPPVGRTYNQNHIPRPRKPGKRRFSIYWTWSYPWEAGRDPASMENRFSTITEVRNVLWPAYETQKKKKEMSARYKNLNTAHTRTSSFQRIASKPASSSDRPSTP